MNTEIKANVKKKMKAGRGEAKESAQYGAEASRSKVKFEIFGEEMIEKCVKLSGNSGRVYLPPTWVGHNVKIIRID